MKQRTIASVISSTGMTLHSGKKSRIQFIPASEDSGINFIRNGVIIPALANYVTQTELSTTLEHRGERVQTVEHLMAAIALLMIDNLYIEVSEPELPIMDGSAYPFLYLLQSAGIVEQTKNKKILVVDKEIIVKDGDKFARLSPANEISYSLGIKFNHSLIDKHKEIEYTYNPKTVDEIIRARTFGFIKDIEYLRSKGLARGGSLDNAIVLNEFGIENSDGLRYPDEFVKHKLIDAIGDMRLLGGTFLGKFTAYKTGHSLNNKLCREALKSFSEKERCSFLVQSNQKVLA